MPRRPLLFLDVDGPLIPFGANASQHYFSFDSDSNPLLARLNPKLGPQLLSLPCDLVWATTWMDEANEVIAPRLGVPELPVVDWPDEDEVYDGLHWKTRGLVGWAAGRTFVWVDDEITEADRRWVSTHHGGEALAYRVEAHLGLADADIAAIRTWLKQAAAN